MRFAWFMLVGSVALGCATGCGDDGGAGGAGGTLDTVGSGDGGAGATATTTTTTTAATATTTTTTATTTTATTTGTGGAGDGGAGDGGAGDGGAGDGGAGDGGAAEGGGGDGGQGTGGSGGAGGGPPLPGYGELSGSCGDIDADDLLDEDPEILVGGIDLTGEDPITLEDPEGLTPGAQQMIEDGNLGGSSLWSEVFAFEVLARCEGATLIKSEGQIGYQSSGGKKTDILVEIDGMKVGVSVVRAVSYPPGDPYPLADALDVLEGKLDDIILSSANVVPEDAWGKQILSVIAQTEEHAESMLAAWDELDDETRHDTIVFVTVTDGDDAFIYYED